VRWNESLSLRLTGISITCPTSSIESSRPIPCSASPVLYPPSQPHSRTVKTWARQHIVHLRSCALAARARAESKDDEPYPASAESTCCSICSTVALMSRQRVVLPSRPHPGLQILQIRPHFQLLMSMRGVDCRKIYEAYDRTSESSERETEWRQRYVLQPINELTDIDSSLFAGDRVVPCFSSV
jgi:hypothetical protein